MQETKMAQKRVLITGVSNRQTNFDYTMRELGELARADNLEVVGEVRQNIDQASHRTYFGKGKVQEIKLKLLKPMLISLSLTMNIPFTN